MVLTEAEDIKKRWQEYTELYKKYLHDPDNHDGVITHLEPDILECEVKWALESITMLTRPPAATHGPGNGLGAAWAQAGAESWSFLHVLGPGGVGGACAVRLGLRAWWPQLHRGRGAHPPALL